MLSTYEDTQDMYDYFSETFLALFILYFPLLSKKLNKNTHPLNPWMTKGLLISRKQKKILCTQYNKSPSALNKNRFKLYRNLYAKLI